MRTLVLLVAFTTLIFACKSRQKDASEVKGMESKNQYDFSILFGSGGGFTGMYDNYELKADGKLYKLKEESEGVLLKTISTEQKEAIFSETEKLVIETRDINEAGNMTHHLGIKKQGEEYKVIWGQPGTPPPNDIQDVYTKLNELLR